MKGEAKTRVKRQQAIAAKNRGEDKRQMLDTKKETKNIMELVKKQKPAPNP